jgi:hypothetical protein
LRQVVEAYTEFRHMTSSDLAYKLKELAEKGLGEKLLTIKEFCDKHKACKEGRDWALANCESMIDAWDKLPPKWLVWVATRPGVLTDKELRLFAVHCARSVEHLLTDQRSKDAIAVAERFANGEATDDELEAAREAAWAAAWAAADAESAWAAAWAAARGAWESAWAAAWAAARAAQADWLRANTRPSFE